MCIVRNALTLSPIVHSSDHAPILGTLEVEADDKIRTAFSLQPVLASRATKCTLANSVMPFICVESVGFELLHNGISAQNTPNLMGILHGLEFWTFVYL